MQIILIVSILANVLLIWHYYGTSDNRYTADDLDRLRKQRDDEYLQLTYKYFRDVHGNDPMKIAREQGKFYDIGRDMKMFDH